MNNANQPPGSSQSARHALPAAENGAASIHQASVVPSGVVSSRGTLEALAPQQALEMLFQDPVGFVRQIVDGAAEQHLIRLKDEAELKGVLNALRRNPEFVRFEPFILQEASMLIQTDPDGVIDPWDQLFEKAFKNFQQKFTDRLKNKPPSGDGTELAGSTPPHVEGKSNRLMPEAPPTFTRAQIAEMSLSEFVKNEAAINEAMRAKRIR